jgi:uncharacterized protein
MTSELVWVLAPAIFLVAVLYASVGHAGASGYIAVMALAGVASSVLRPTALVLNIAVAIIGTWQFASAGFFSWRRFWPFALLAVPAAFVGGYLDLPTAAFKVLVGLVLLFAAARLAIGGQQTAPPTREAPLAVALVTGAALGLLAGLTGTGGGIFLTPLLLLAGWADAKQAAAVSAPFILVNSAAGLAGNLATTRTLDAIALPLLAAAVIGGFIGSRLGSRRMPVLAIRRTLAAVLVVAGTKLVFFH